MDGHAGLAGQLRVPTCAWPEDEGASAEKPMGRLSAPKEKRSAARRWFSQARQASVVRQGLEINKE